VKLGVLLFSQATSWVDFRAAAALADRVGYDHIWTWDHLYAIFGDPYQPIFEGWTAIAALSGMTTHAHLGLMVGANTFRNPGIVAKMATTIDHASDGRAILGIGAAWFELEHRAHGIDFGATPGDRLRWLEEAVGVVRGLLDGKEVNHRSKKYAFEGTRHSPLPVQRRLPIMIGGGGEKKTLRIVAKYADMWNLTQSDPEAMQHKDEVLREHCRDVGRDEREIERTVLIRPVIRDDRAEAERVWDAQMAHNKVSATDPKRRDPNEHVAGSVADFERLLTGYAAIGFNTVILELASPFDHETIERFATEVRPRLESAAPAGSR
jgi:alkanesulfonate monooxygenase SsuD/methylene tetrahydromethanopterin reductase-like flavin-dependent oxidoreductase (luciferase family)